MIKLTDHFSREIKGVERNKDVQCFTIHVNDEDRLHLLYVPPDLVVGIDSDKLVYDDTDELHALLNLLMTIEEGGIT